MTEPIPNLAVCIAWREAHENANCKQRVARLCLGPRSNDLSAVKATLPFGIGQRAVTRQVALSIDGSLERGRRTRFRRGLAVLYTLHAHDLARRSGLLPAPIGPLPTVRDHALLEPLPRTLLALRTRVPRPTQNAIDDLWRLAVEGGVFQRCDDPSLDEVAARFPEIACLDPASRGLGISDRARKKYLHKLAKVLVEAGCVDPRVTMPRAVWWQLKTAVRAVGIDPERLNGVMRPADRDGLGPHEVTPAWCSETLIHLDRVSANAFPTSAYLLDGLRDDDRIPAELLPAEATRLARQLRPRGSPKPPPAPRPAVLEAPYITAWKQLFGDARAQGLDNRALLPLSTLRVRAIEAGLGPRDLSVDWILDLLNPETLGKRAAIYASTRLLDDFAMHPVLGELVPAERLAEAVMDGRRDRWPLSSAMMADLTETLDRMGMSAASRREAAAAAKALAEVSGDQPSLDALMAEDFESLDWSAFANRAAAYRLVLDRIRSFRDLPWTKSWRALQRAVVGAGVAMRENPVPRLLPCAAGREPK